MILARKFHDYIQTKILCMKSGQNSRPISVGDMKDGPSFWRHNKLQNEEKTENTNNKKRNVLTTFNRKITVSKCIQSCFKNVLTQNYNI